MNFHKIIQIVVGLLSIAGIIFLARIIAEGDEEIKAAAATGDTAIVSPMTWIAFITLFIILFFVLAFVIKGLFSNPAALKKTLINVGIFVLLFLICYFVIAKGVETPLRDGKVLSAGGSKLVGAGLWLFYLLALIAGGSMLYYGVKKMISK